MENDFRERMLEKISLDKLNAYYKIFSTTWPIGASARDSDEILSLDQSIYNFFKGHVSNPNDYVRKALKKSLNPLFTPQELTDLILVNKNLLELYFNNYASYCSDNGLEISASEIWLHRGIHLAKPYKDGKYIENRFMNSYSTSITIVEQFSKIIPNKKPTLVSGKLFDLFDRVIVFYAFIPNMNSNQQEVILMPAAKDLKVKLVHTDGNLLEYEFEQHQQTNNQSKTFTNNTPITKTPSSTQALLSPP
jgi:hypothetical protein